MLLVETVERFLDPGEITCCYVDVADEFIDVFEDDLELDGHVGERFTIGSGLLNGGLVYCWKLGYIIPSWTP